MPSYTKVCWGVHVGDLDHVPRKFTYLLIIVNRFVLRCSNIGTAFERQLLVC